jgi:hypothetical protein
MGVEVFDDPVGQRIKSLLMNYALENYSGAPDSLEASVERTHLIVSFARQAAIDTLNAEIEVMTFRNANAGEPQIPTLFIAGLLHAADVIGGRGSVIGQG